MFFRSDLIINSKNEDKNVVLEIEFPEKFEFSEMFFWFDFQIEDKYFSELVFFSLEDFDNFNSVVILLKILDYPRYNRSKKMKIYQKYNTLKIDDINILIKEYYLENKSVFISKKIYSFDNLQSKFKFYFKFDQEINDFYTNDKNISINVLHFLIEYIIYFVPLFYIKRLLINKLLKEKIFK